MTLDSPLLQQTKSEIRSIAAEIAALAQANIEPSQFYDGFLPRLTLALGAVGAALWQVTSAQAHGPHDFALLSQHQLPGELVVERRPTPAHQQVLASVLAEAQPILVPPASVAVEAARPQNPLSEALIVVPVRIHERIEVLVEVVQRATGGPAAQRGYLRFVAQMSDLLADYLRQHRLHELMQQQQATTQLQESLLNAVAAEHPGESQQIIVNALRQLLRAEHAALVQLSPRARTLAIADTRSFDPRSALVLAVAEFCRQVADNTAADVANVGRLQAFDASERRGDRAQSDNESPWQAQVDRLCEQLGCRRLVVSPLGSQGNFAALFSFADAQVPLQQQLASERPGVDRATTVLGRLLERPQLPSRRLALKRLVAWPAARTSSVRRWRLRAAVLLACTALAFLPVPQRIRAIGVLRPASKQNYYAPLPATVAQVLVTEGQSVQAGEPLLTLASPELEGQVLQLQADVARYQQWIANQQEELGKRGDLSAEQQALLERDLHTYENELQACRQELQLRQQQRELLTIRARQAGRVSSWALENRLLGRPVVSDDLLISTYDPEADWYVEVAVPENRLGLVAKGLERQPSELAVEFLLTSFPDRIINGQLRSLGAQPVLSSLSAPSDMAARVVSARVEVPATALPIKKEGAIAQAAIDCGWVPVWWLVSRDAIQQVGSRIRMLW